MILGASSAYAKVVTYQFDINTKSVNFTGESVVALAINNQIPGPTIEATVGDTLEVTFNNKMDTETSIHWHGILLPNDQDGVPYLTTQPIAPHSSFTYRYKITHHGTYWYHSHAGLQEQRMPAAGPGSCRLPASSRSRFSRFALCGSTSKTRCGLW